MKWENKQEDPCILNVLVPGSELNRKHVNKDLTKVLALEKFTNEAFFEISFILLPPYKLLIDHKYGICNQENLVCGFLSVRKVNL